MFSRDEFIYVGGVAARKDDSRYRLAQLTAPASSVLDVGCAVGYIGRFIRSQAPDIWLGGIEIDPRAAEEARPSYDQMIVGSIDDPAVWQQVRRRVDAMIFGDVLEHTADPSQVLALAQGKLEDGGRIVISIPNIAYIKARLRLLAGTFEYEDWGIMDRTHLRFFTRQTARRMIEEGGFQIVHEETIHSYPVPEQLSGPARSLFLLKRGTKALLARLRPTLFAQQFILVALKASPALVTSAVPQR